MVADAASQMAERHHPDSVPSSSGAASSIAPVPASGYRNLDPASTTAHFFSWWHDQHAAQPGGTRMLQPIIGVGKKIVQDMWAIDDLDDQAWMTIEYWNSKYKAPPGLYWQMKQGISEWKKVFDPEILQYQLEQDFTVWGLGVVNSPRASSVDSVQGQNAF
ncbi:hypothetical protein K491DRAFT_743618 [Lophiostoma macrostomum CBS 122681]|uniref:Uncharacterized protein n=1 Tax=Lophiostoma macrostomum CBS 122681 TaxID=1314788 RepID=A0A6A6SLJ7_9PLEO|nr:hypothetical protein K491DRAFT_743618 [Lophiostoma macrostomum CBS 122681]